jgi:HEAT repeat protein
MQKVFCKRCKKELAQVHLDFFILNTMHQGVSETEYLCFKCASQELGSIPDFEIKKLASKLEKCLNFKDFTQTLKKHFTIPQKTFEKKKYTGRLDIDSLLQAMKSDDLSICAGAAEAFKKAFKKEVRNRKEIILKLIHLISPQGLDNRFASKKWSESEIENFHNFIDIISRTIVSFGEAAIEPLGRLLKDKRRKYSKDPLKKDREVSFINKIIRILAEIKGEEVLQLLIEILLDENEERKVRAAAATSLARLRDRRAMEPLIKTTNDKDSVVRGYALCALKSLQSRERRDFK